MMPMLYLSQILNKPIFYKSRSIGKVIDLAITEKKEFAFVSKVLIKKANKTYSSLRYNLL